MSSYYKYLYLKTYYYIIIISNMDAIENWVENNFIVLVHLFHKLIEISSLYKINVINNQDSFNNFLLMMYNESDKTSINSEYINYS